MWHDDGIEFEFEFEERPEFEMIWMKLILHFRRNKHANWNKKLSLFSETSTSTFLFLFWHFRNLLNRHPLSKDSRRKKKQQAFDNSIKRKSSQWEHVWALNSTQKFSIQIIVARNSDFFNEDEDETGWDARGDNEEMTWLDLFKFTDLRLRASL